MNTSAPFAPSTVQRTRKVEQLATGVRTRDGAGVSLTRLLGQTLQRRLDPFLMLDAFGSDDPDEYIAGFPDHPHRGFETITYMLAGRMQHRDSAGHEGLLEAGGVQWMTAGRGVIHAEIPQQSEGRMEGFQFWLNLPARDKMCDPWYQDFSAAELPRLRTPAGVDIILIAGRSHGIAAAPTRALTDPLIADIHMPPGTRFAQPIPPTHNAFLHVYRGSATVADSAIPSGPLALLDNDPQADGILIQTNDQAARLLLVAGHPLRERIVQHGPFVMNSEQEIYQAINDYRNGRLGR